MYVETFDFRALATTTEAKQKGWLRRILERVRTFGVTYELSDHLASDVGFRCYTLPLFSPAEGGWK